MTTRRTRSFPPAVERRRTSAQARFLRALTTVERIRRLSKPRGPRVVVNRTVAESPQILDVTGRPTEAKSLERDG